jgi:catechol 2,3-dioxygenase-like lactoylglutathione lyase family enzyme
MIRGAHTMFYTSEPEALRAFLRDVLGLPGSDVGDGWLIFDLPEADIAAHPLEEDGPPAGTPYLSFYCDDLETTMAELGAKGVRFTAGVENRGYGLATRFAMPGGVEVELYQPLYTKVGRPPTGGGE